jgi:histone deacetylase complex regulatory component SIN3
MLEKILNDDGRVPEEKISCLIDQIISMGIIQLVYKNCNKEQKEELEWHLKTNQCETLRILRDRVHFQIKEMESIKSIHAIRAWYEVASKNFSKALDLKGF